MTKRNMSIRLVSREFLEEELVDAFTEWDRRFREEPERFQSEAIRLLKETPESYGAACAPYFLMILNELRFAKCHA